MSAQHKKKILNYRYVGPIKKKYIFKYKSAPKRWLKICINRALVLSFEWRKFRGSSEEIRSLTEEDNFVGAVEHLAAAVKVRGNMMKLVAEEISGEKEL